ncbi:hypothetical protein KH5H1_47710 [Corallococcus caeni]|nr:hypothetical protein KH5H1_47710 [Corallococcus sp. KH5-1]
MEEGPIVHRQRVGRGHQGGKQDESGQKARGQTRTHPLREGPTSQHVALPPDGTERFCAEGPSTSPKRWGERHRTAGQGIL